MLALWGQENSRCEGKKVDRNIFALTIDDVGVEGFSSVEDLSDLLEFLKKHGVSATLFVTPFNRDRALDKRDDWVDILKRALQDGHELGLHGYRHEACEFGIPPDMILEYEHDGQDKS